MFEHQAHAPKPTDRNLRVSHFPQVPCKPFHIYVDTIEEAADLMGVLAQYDLFQLKHHIKPDFSNATTVEMWEDGEWTTWCDPDTGNDDPEEFVAGHRTRKNAHLPTMVLP